MSIEWKQIDIFDGMYSVSTTGLIRNNVTDKILKQSIIKTGYYSVTVRPFGRKGVCKCFRTHREVAIAFLSKINEKIFVNHKDGNKLNNDVSNLEWCTASENSRHAVENGLMNTPKGERVANARMTDELVRIIREEYKNGNITMADIGKKYGVAPNTISNAINRVSWKHVF